jgi:hypothetical protein
MSRILDYIEKYDENLTIAQLKKAIELEKISEKEVELEEINRVRSSFKDVYLKEIDEDSVFGRTLNIYHLKNYVRSERTEDWSLIYYFEGNRISFSKKDLNRKNFNPDRCGDSFDEKELTNMKIISEQEYLKYNLEYEQIVNKLEDLIL